MYSFHPVLLVNILLIFNVFCKNVQHRDPRFIRGTYTTTFTETTTTTKLIPSSCVQVDPTLPPCRAVRFMRFPTFNQVDNGDSRPQPKSDSSEPAIQTTQLGWGEYLGLYAPTATLNVTETKTTTVEDPRVVVTFAVKGCRPMRLPMDLSRCPRDFGTTLPIREVLPTSRVGSVSPSRTQNSVTPKNTKVIDLAEVPDYGFQNVNAIQANELESTRENNDNLETPTATEPLP